MDRIPASPPQILPIERPEKYLWSVMIPTYNCSHFLVEAMESVLAQNVNPLLMQIEVVDDASTDADVEKLVADIGRGRVSYYRQPFNVGSLRNFETCINRAQGKYIHLLHGDDRVKPGFYREIEALFNKFPQAGAAFSRWSYLNNRGRALRHFDKEAETTGILDNLLFKLAQRQRIQYVAIVVKREVYEHLGGFFGVTYGEDWEMWARIAKHYPIAYTPTVLAEYREHTDNSISKTSFINGKNIRDINWVIDIVNTYLPKEAAHIKVMGKKIYANWALNYTRELWFITHNDQIVYDQIKEIKKMYMDPALAFKITLLMARMAIHPFRKRFGLFRRPPASDELL